MAGDVYERMEMLARGMPPQRALRQRLIEVVLIVASVFLLAYLLYAAQFSGTVRWLLGFTVIAAVALYAFYAVSQGTGEPAPLARPSALRGGRSGELENFTLVVRRADMGLPYSQAFVSSRARDAFAERVRLARGLSADGMRRLEHDAAGLHAAFRDPVLEDFLFLASAESDARYRWLDEAKARQGYHGELIRVLDRMEGWR